MLFSNEVVERERLPAGEYYALTLFAICGMMMMAAARRSAGHFPGARDAVAGGLRADRAAARERGQRRSGVQVFPARLVLQRLLPLRYGVCVRGRRLDRLDQIGVALSAQGAGTPPTLALLAVGLLAVGFAFKVSAVPFHMWTPDAYEGRTDDRDGVHVDRREGGGVRRVRACVSVSARAAAGAVGAGAVGRRRGHDDRGHGRRGGADEHQADARVLEHRARRLPADRGHFELPTNGTGKAAVLFYLLSYAVTNLGALGIVALLGTLQNQHDELRDFAGLWKSRPALAGLMTVFLLSLGGLPPTAGFIGKWYIFTAAVQEGHYWLAIIGVLTSVVSVFFYLRIVVMMYMTEGTETPRPRVPATAMAGLALATAAVFYLGVLPTKVLDLALASIATIF